MQKLLAYFSCNCQCVVEEEEGRPPPAAVHFCCTAHIHTHAHVYFCLFCFAWLIWQTLQAFPHLHTLTHRQRRRSSACESKCCRERERESRRDNVVVVVVGSGPSVERVQNDEVRLKYVSKPNNCRYCHYFWPTFKWKRERADDVSASAIAAATAKSTLALLANMFSFNVYSL